MPLGGLASGSPSYGRGSARQVELLIEGCCEEEEVLPQ